MAKAVLSVVGANMGALRCSRVVSSSTALRLLLPPTSSSSCLRICPTTTTNNSYSSSPLGLGLGLGLVVLNPGERRVASAPIAMVSTTKSETHPHRRVGSRRSLNTTIPATNTPHHHHVNDSGSIDSSLINSMQTKIKEQLNAESVIVKDAYGDGRHVSIDVISSAFEGESAVSRQRMVYKAIWEELQNTVHAVDQMTTKTPSEAATNK